MSLAEPSCGPSFLLHTQADREQPLPLFLLWGGGFGLFPCVGFIVLQGVHLSLLLH